ncbi:MAG: hypothetical protein QOF30_1537 [Acidimicrobiaceae bacterium]|jgi:hypothetical protein|nr:hypothetical protein [Acidimicrobiaceae bacterium]
MHPTHLAQLTQDHQSTLRRQAAESHLRPATRPTSQHRRPRYEWHFRSPIVRRPAPIQTVVCR